MCPSEPWLRLRIGMSTPDKSGKQSAGGKGPSAEVSGALLSRRMLGRYRRCAGLSSSRKEDGVHPWDQNVVLSPVQLPVGVYRALFCRIRRSYEKSTVFNSEKAQEIAAKVPTPFHIYDEAGIRSTARAMSQAFAWNPGFREYFAVKATPNPYILQILHEEGCGCDCATYSELLLSEAAGITGREVMFSSNETPEQDLRKAWQMGGVYQPG